MLGIADPDTPYHRGEEGEAGLGRAFERDRMASWKSVMASVVGLEDFNFLFREYIIINVIRSYYIGTGVW